MGGAKRRPRCLCLFCGGILKIRRACAHCFFADEMADVFAFILLFAEHEQIDLNKALERKWFERLKE